MAVAETWHPTNDRTYLYARPNELGQVFDFALLKSTWDRDQFQRVIQQSITSHAVAGGGLTWVLSSHDVPRHASRLALPGDVDLDSWILSNGTMPVIDPEQGRRRARAATLMMLALPGSAYLYQGEELGLLEVVDLPTSVLQDPVWERTGGTLRGRDGCRVPLPWTRTGSSFGFGDNGSWLPQPAEFGRYSVEAQDGVNGSTLEMYREALRLRRRHPALHGSEFAWRDAPEGLLIFDRGESFRCIVNLSQASHPVNLEGLTVLLASTPFTGSGLPPDHAIWLTTAMSA
jgi:alpha-glucosidase